MKWQGPKYEVGDTITNGRAEFAIESEEQIEWLFGEWQYNDPSDPDWCSIPESDARLVDDRDRHKSIGEIFQEARQ